MTPELGIIEGFYGRPWSWQERAVAVAFLAPHGYSFYLYAPKSDAFLRRRWQEDHPADTETELTAFARHCTTLGVRFGVGLSPYEIYRDFDETARAALTRKLAFLDRIGVHDLAVLFDDMRGDMPGLAARQVEIVHWIRARSHATRLLMCPTYYSDDPVLDRIFGARPSNYLEELGATLDPDIHVFWTGEEICSREFSVGDLRHVAAVLRRRPFLWDNYPVNDTERMSRYLHLRGFTGRPAAIGEHAAAHGINPALQPVLSRIPALTLVDSYREGSDYRYGAAMAQAAATVLGPELGEAICQDLLWFHDVGRAGLDDARVAELRQKYSAFDHDGAREIVSWLDGAYQVTKETIQSQ